MTLEVYDVNTESMRTLRVDDLALLRQMAWAYGRVREVRGQASGRGALWLVTQLDEIHGELRERLKRE